MTTTAAPTASAPPSSKHRLPALDVLRGIAILGTLLTNIWIFATPRNMASMSESELGAIADGGVWANAFQTALGLVTDGKFIGLLTIMFGIGLEIQRQSALRRGETWPGRYPWRAGILVLDGLLNYIFIFEFDVLMGYGLTALAVSAIMMTSPKAQKIWMIVGLAVHVAVIVGFDLLQSVFVFLGGVPTDIGDRASEAENAVGAAGPALDAMGSGSTDSYWAMVHERLITFVGGRAEIPIMFLMGIGLFLVGAHLYRAGIFEERGRQLRRRIMLLSFGIGLPLDWTLRLFLSDYTGGITRYITSSLVAFGILALVAQFYVRRGSTGVVGTGLSAVGKMALTCYILQNLIASIIFYDWGFGMAGRIQGEYAVWLTMLIYLGIAGFLVALSLVWQRYFKRGPVEWLWHATYDGIGTVLDRRRARVSAG
ncbi:DUF418 domain-containing protein [Kocuria sp.]|uniref:DUF418 domain-containing protein n=1 Tax=Kocuria sp. TaxID=1871328 RepID=UPI0026DF6C0E|nr:DUF418 domain-containing protein [Kocuria sp.]MDO5618539.1 DUF418 domain-containing protein [Kocuria sp.]